MRTRHRWITSWTRLLPALGLSACVTATLDGAPPGEGGGREGGGREDGGEGGRWLDDGIDIHGGSGGAPAERTGPAPEGSPQIGKSWQGDALGWAPPANAGDGGGGGAPAADDCPGEAVTLTAGSPVTIQGTLADAADDLTTFCADSSSSPGNPDKVYQLSVAAETTVSIQVTAAFNPALSLRRSTCSSEQNGDACVNYGAASEQMKTVLPAGTFWLVVESADGNTGAFNLDLTPAAPACGDGVLNTGETCDPGGAAANDGCHDPATEQECTFGEAPSSTDVTQCPGLGPLSVSAANDHANRLIEGPHHNGAGGHSEENDTTADLSICGWPATGPENVFHITPQSTGTLHARIGHDDSGQVVCDLNPLCGDFILYVRKDQCAPAEPADPLQQTACVDFDAGFQEILEVAVPVVSGEDYWVFVDGYDDTWGLGVYWLELWMTQ